MQEKDVVAVIRHLIETVEDGRDGFRVASDAVANLDLKMLFKHYAEQCGSFSHQLHRVAEAHGDAIEENVPHHGWKEIQHAARERSPRAILTECEREEDHALTEYRRALSKPLPPDVETVLGAQSLEVRAALNKVRCLRMLVSAQP